jgi:hypothetical protein
MRPACILAVADTYDELSEMMEIYPGMLAEKILLT